MPRPTLLSLGALIRMTSLLGSVQFAMMHATFLCLLAPLLVCAPPQLLSQQTPPEKAAAALARFEDAAAKLESERKQKRQSLAAKYVTVLQAVTTSARLTPAQQLLLRTEIQNAQAGRSPFMASLALEPLRVQRRQYESGWLALDAQFDPSYQQLQQAALQTLLPLETAATAGPVVALEKRVLLHPWKSLPHLIMLKDDEMVLAESFDSVPDGSFVEAFETADRRAKPGWFAAKLPRTQAAEARLPSAVVTEKGNSFLRWKMDAPPARRRMAPLRHGWHFESAVQDLMRPFAEVRWSVRTRRAADAAALLEVDARLHGFTSDREGILLRLRASADARKDETWRTWTSEWTKVRRNPQDEPYVDFRPVFDVGSPDIEGIELDDVRIELKMR